MFNSYTDTNYCESRPERDSRPTAPAFVARQCTCLASRFVYCESLVSSPAPI